MSKAADSMAQGDFVEKGIMSVVNWSLLPIHIGPNERGTCTVIKKVFLETYVKLMRKSQIRSIFKVKFLVFI